MSSSTPFLSEELFQCSLCLDVFTHPVSLPCGHTFCQSCILAQWMASGSSHCPKCSAVFQETPELCENSFAREMAEQIRKQKGQRSSVYRPVTSDNVLCDMCPLEKASSAVKSCLVCVASYCEVHVMSHTSRFTKHKLVQPQRMEKRICRIHERPLELYCRYDQSAVCVLCMNTEHNTHHTIPVETEWAERKTQLLKTQSDLKQMIMERWSKVEELKHSIKLNKENTEREMAYSVEVFTALQQFIERSQSELLRKMKQEQKTAEKHVEGLIKELKVEIAKLNARNSELEKLSSSEDHLYLIQAFRNPGELPQCKSWSQISVHTCQGLEVLRETLNTAEELLKTQIYTVTKRELEAISQYAVDMTLDPDTANPWLAVSADRKRVTDSNVEHNVPNSAQRFDSAPCVLSRELISRGRSYWEVGVSGKTAWDLGVAKKSVTRKGLVTLSPEDGYWAVCLRGGSEYRACDRESVLLSLKTLPQRIGIYVDFEKGQISFYDPRACAHIFSFTGQCFNESLLAYFNPDMNDTGNNNAPLVIQPVNDDNRDTVTI
ncbi:E3 ubiquitin-protein ligase TRIM39 [Megalobrama amblycephala]|uniref:E3 ubiquitin-protein ligase TRIM39 n=1 Tax=Megalobrama amblycephala TaxID=75352 RepID=UPI0020140865|nr:E3 ubiquitin-protein ligase TRIM39 [Megalobrama amblycephala]XP_048030261.1 E3 ubiquitin-protein ligase TRIM39 [Megalobrama amblycephala]